MPKRARRDKLNSTRVGIRSIGTSRSVESVKALLSRSSQSALRAVAEHRQVQFEWRKWLENKLPEALRAHVTGVAAKPDALVVFAASSAWSARLRFALVELEPAIKKENGAIRSVSVRVMPKR